MPEPEDLPQPDELAVTPEEDEAYQIAWAAFEKVATDQQLVQGTEEYERAFDLACVRHPIILKQRESDRQVATSVKKVKKTEVLKVCQRDPNRKRRCKGGPTVKGRTCTMCNKKVGAL